MSQYEKERLFKLSEEWMQVVYSEKDKESEQAVRECGKELRELIFVLIQEPI